MPAPTSEEKKLEWKNRIEQQRQSGLTIEKWCLQNQIRSCTFHYWKDKLSSKPLQKSSFTEVNRKQPETIILQTRGIHIRMDGDANLQLRKQLFALFVEASC